jgi:class 3 adenylate cyclase
VRTCPSCGHRNSNDARFCSQCAAALDSSARPREERKVVTVLFVDLVGFTARAETLDPEDVQALLAFYHDRVRAELERYGGTVERLVGDGVMALFGAPVAHEDDPERAVRAACAIRDGFAELARDDPSRELHVRIGVNTGEVLVALPATPGAGGTMSAGDAVNTAARLEAAAPVDGILVGEATHRATERSISYRERAPIAAKGKSQLVAAWEALEPRARFGAAARPLRGSPLVGRTHELDVLVGALARVRQERMPQLVTLVGVPGIGKSRLVSELFGFVDADPELIRWRQGRSPPYGDGVTFWALAEMVKAEAGIVEADAEEQAREKLRAAVALLEEEKRNRAERHLAPLVGLEGETDAQDRREESFAAWRRWLEALAEQRPLILVFEDLHWADDHLLDFVDYLVEWVTGVPLLVVGTARPELLLRRPSWGGGKPNATTLTLPPLSDEETARLLHALLERSVLPAELQAQLLERAAGNPLYAEEFVRMAGQRTTLEQLALPESVHGLIAARIDALHQDEKALLQDAAVVGRVFWADTLAAVEEHDPAELEALLHALERKEFVRRERRSTLAGESAYAFCHVLVRDVAYGQIPRGLRAEKHRLAAEWLTSLHRSEDQAELVAHHYASALRLAQSARQDTQALVERTRHALKHAGDRALGLNAFGPAGRYYRKALELSPAGDPVRPYLLFRLGSVLYTSEGRGADELAEAVEGLLAAGDKGTAAEAEVFLGEIAWQEADRSASDRHLERAAELVADVTSSPAKARVLAALARSFMLAGMSETAIAFGHEALHLAEALGLEELRATALSYIGSAQVRLGDRSGMERQHEAVEIARAANSPQLARWLNNYAGQVWEQGDATRAFALWDEAGAIARRDGALAMARFLDGFQVFILFEQGRWAESLAAADAFIPSCEESPNLQEAVVREVRGTIRLARGEAAGATSDLERGVEVARRSRIPHVLFALLVSRAFVLADLGELAAASEEVDEIVALSESAPLDQELVYATVLFESLDLGDELVRIREHANANRWRDALDLHLAGDPGGAADVCEEIGALGSAARWRLLAGQLLAEQGRHAEADVHLEQARRFYRSVGAARYVSQIEALLSATA